MSQPPQQHPFDMSLKPGDVIQCFYAGTNMGFTGGKRYMVNADGNIPDDDGLVTSPRGVFRDRRFTLVSRADDGSWSDWHVSDAPVAIDHGQLKADVAAGTPIYDALVICHEVYHAVYSGPMQLVDRAAYLAVTARLAVLEKAKWQVRHVDTMNDFVLVSMARDDETARADRAEAELAALRASRLDVRRAERGRCASVGTCSQWAPDEMNHAERQAWIKGSINGCSVVIAAILALGDAE